MEFEKVAMQRQYFDGKKIQSLFRAILGTFSAAKT